MTIGVISDTHNNFQAIDTAFNYLKQQNISLVIHAGDWTSSEAVSYIDDLANYLSLHVIGVIGNNDKEVEMKLNQKELTLKNTYICPADYFSTSIVGHTVAVCHGHKHQLLTDLITEDQFNLVITGHTHKEKLELVNKTYVVNPGSISFSIPRRKNDNGTVATIDMQSLEVVFTQL